MNLSRLLAVLLIAAFGACATIEPPLPPPSYYAMRHLQKAAGQDPGLSEEGQRLAWRLPAWFGRDPPAAIYVSTTRRARETAAPLATQLRLRPKEYDPSDTPALIARVTAETGTVLIVGHSNTVPDIVERLGGARPADIGEADYGDIWHVWGPERKVERGRVGVD
jgi:broad specificity phosphatase PhoE